MAEDEHGVVAEPQADTADSESQRPVDASGETEASPRDVAVAATREAAATRSILISRLGELVEQLEEANRIGRERERIIDKLHDENQRLRAGELEQALMPVLRDLVRLFDDLQHTAEAYGHHEQVSGEDVLKEFQCYAGIVSDALYRQGVERYEATPGMAFDPKVHRALAAVPTSDQSLDRTLARVIRPGFRNDGRILRPLEAEVYRFTPESGSKSPKNDE